MSCEQWTIVKGGRRSRHRAQTCESCTCDTLIIAGFRAISEAIFYAADHNGHSDHQLHPASNQRSHSPEEITCRVDKLHGTFSSIKAQVHDSEFFRQAAVPHNRSSIYQKMLCFSDSLIPGCQFQDHQGMPPVQGLSSHDHEFGCQH